MARLIPNENDKYWDAMPDQQPERTRLTDAAAPTLSDLLKSIVASNLTIEEHTRSIQNQMAVLGFCVVVSPVLTTSDRPKAESAMTRLADQAASLHHVSDHLRTILDHLLAQYSA